VDFPALRMPAPPILTVAHPDCRGFQTPVSQGILAVNFASAAWVGANTAYMWPFKLTDWATAYQLLFMVGATSSGNIDVGIYDAQKNKVVSAGSTAMSATVNTVQELNITDTLLAPGDYLLAAACDNTTATCFRSAPPDETQLSIAPVYEQAGLTAAALTNPAVPVI
jgi:hypothetical protein